MHLECVPIKRKQRSLLQLYYDESESQVLFQISDLKCANVRGADGWRAEWSTLSSLTQITMTGWQYLILLEGMVTAQILHRVTIATAGVTQCYMFM